jgi:tetratricopeptide (TPR) repeat protein
MFQESIDLFREIGDAPGTAYPLCGLARVALQQGNYAEAEARSREGLAMARTIGDRLLVVTNLHFVGSALHARGDRAGALVAFNEALAIARDLGNPSLLGDFLNSLGRAQCDAGHPDVAENHFKEAITILHDLRFQAATAESLEGLATAAFGNGSTLRAVRCWACAHTLREESGAGMSRSEQSRHDSEMEAARAQLPVGTFEQAWDEGCAMTVEEAVRYALDGQRRAG